jgi:hypothetical protein
MISGGTLAAMSDDRQAEAASSNGGGGLNLGAAGGGLTSGGTTLTSSSWSSKLALSSVFLAFTATKQLLLSLIFLGSCRQRFVPSIGKIEKTK